MTPAADDIAELDRLIFEAAEYGRAEDRAAVARLLRGRELFAPVGAMNLSPPPGATPITVGPDTDLRLPTVTAGEKILLALYTRPNHPRLAGRQYIGIAFEEMLNMVERSPGLDGFLVYNAADSYFGLTRDGFAWLRNLPE